MDVRDVIQDNHEVRCRIILKLYYKLSGKIYKRNNILNFLNAINDMPVVVNGARQTGKSTFISMLLGPLGSGTIHPAFAHKRIASFTLDDFTTRIAAQHIPELFLPIHWQVVWKSLPYGLCRKGREIITAK
jgi:hypothetical protein